MLGCVGRRRKGVRPREVCPWWWWGWPPLVWMVRVLRVLRVVRVLVRAVLGVLGAVARAQDVQVAGGDQVILEQGDLQQQRTSVNTRHASVRMRGMMFTCMYIHMCARAYSNVGRHAYTCTHSHLFTKLV